MDRVGLIVLRAEALADCEVIADAAGLARERVASQTPAGLEACAFQLARLYNAVEQLGTRTAKSFENTIDDERGWHTELVRRLSLPIPGIRPPLFPPDLLPDLHELRAFRHVVRHAYDFVLREEKLLPLISSAERVASTLPETVDEFVKKVAAANGWRMDSDEAGDAKS